MQVTAPSTPLREKPAQEKPKTTKITVFHRGKPGVHGVRVIHDHRNHAYAFGPGEQAEIEVTEAEAERLTKLSKDGSDLQVHGAEVKEEDDRDMSLRKQPSRADIEKKEAENAEQARRQMTRRGGPEAPEARGAANEPPNRSGGEPGSEDPANPGARGDKRSRAELEAMSKEELRGIADQHEVEYTTRTSKDELIDGIVAAQRHR